MQQTCFAIESTGYVITVNEILVCEHVTVCNVAPPGVGKLNKQALAFGYVVTVKLNSGVQMEVPPSELSLCGNAIVVQVQVLFCSVVSFSTASSNVMIVK